VWILSEERLRRVEELLLMILDRLNELEKRISSTDPQSARVVNIAGKLMFSLSIPAVKALEAATLITRLSSSLTTRDDISRTIIEVLAVEEEVTLSELTRLVRKVRGRASRRIISEKVRMLNEKGIVDIRKAGNRVYVRLKKVEQN
jgi:DNA-binding transcriptional ArsR family regulator